MQPKTRRIIIGIIAALLALVMILPMLFEALVLVGDAATSVDSLNQRLDNLEREKAQIQEELNRVRAQKRSATAEKEAIDKKISVTAKEIATIDALISQLDAENAQCQAELDKKKQEEKETYALFKDRIRAMEENGRVSYLTVILSADSFSSMVARTEIVSTVMEYDRGIMSELKKQQQEIAAKQEQIAESKSAQETARAQLAAKKAELTEQENEAVSVLKSITSEENEIEKAFNEAEAAQKAARAEIKRILAAQNGGGNSKAYVGGDLTWPVPGKYTITSPYGTRTDPISKKKSHHTGVDIAAGTGVPIVAANSGTVIVSGWSSKGYGNYIVIDHGGGRSTLYAHQSRLAVKKGEYVVKGQTIGYVGSTGYSTGPHLHFEVLINGDDVNPMNYYKKG